MNQFFSGTYPVKLDSKNRFVLPQSLRYALVEEGELEFYIALSMGGCLAIYKKSDMQKIVEGFKQKRHIAKFQKFFTLFFSTLYHTGVDKIGRVSLSKTLKESVGIEQEIMLVGSMDKIQVWPKQAYEKEVAALMNESNHQSFADLWQEALNDSQQETLEGVLEKREVIKV